MKNLFLSYKRRSVWKNYQLIKKFQKFNNSILVKRNFLLTRYFVYKYRYCYVFFKNYPYKLKLSRKYIGFKIGQFIRTKKLGKDMHIIKIKKKKKNKK